MRCLQFWPNIWSRFISKGFYIPYDYFTKFEQKRLLFLNNQLQSFEAHDKQVVLGIFLIARVLVSEILMMASQIAVGIKLNCNIHFGYI